MSYVMLSMESKLALKQEKPTVRSFLHLEKWTIFLLS